MNLADAIDQLVKVRQTASHSPQMVEDAKYAILEAIHQTIDTQEVEGYKSPFGSRKLPTPLPNPVIGN